MCWDDDLAALEEHSESRALLAEDPPRIPALYIRPFSFLSQKTKELYIARATAQLNNLLDILENGKQTELEEAHFKHAAGKANNVAMVAVDGKQDEPREAGSVRVSEDGKEGNEDPENPSEPSGAASGGARGPSSAAEQTDVPDKQPGYTIKLQCLHVLKV
eukprot:tig00000113_g5664.t1